MYISEGCQYLHDNVKRITFGKILILFIWHLFFFNAVNEIPLGNISDHTSHGSAVILLGMLDDLKIAKPNAKAKPACLDG